VKQIEELIDAGGFELCAYTVGLKTKTLLSSDVLMGGLTEVAANFPDLSDLKFDKEDN